MNAGKAGQKAEVRGQKSEVRGKKLNGRRNGIRTGSGTERVLFKPAKFTKSPFEEPTSDLWLLISDF